LTYLVDTLNFFLNIIPFLLFGLQLTLEVSILAFILGMALGSILTLVRVFLDRPWSMFALSYIEFFRGTPLLVQIFIIYFGLPYLGIRFDPLTASILALGLNSAAYQAEILRASINAIPKSQYMSAESLGMSRIQIYRYVILPQALRNAVPALVNEVVALIKDSSLASVIGLVELTKRGRYLVATTFRVFEVYMAVALIYLIVCLACSKLSKILEAKISIPGYMGGLR